jgi:hypothetical protein
VPTEYISTDNSADIFQNEEGNDVEGTNNVEDLF